MPTIVISNASMSGLIPREPYENLVNSLVTLLDLKDPEKDVKVWNSRSEFYQLRPGTHEVRVEPVFIVVFIQKRDPDLLAQVHPIIRQFIIAIGLGEDIRIVLIQSDDAEYSNNEKVFRQPPAHAGPWDTEQDYYSGLIPD